MAGPLRVDEPVLLATKLHPPGRRGLLPRPGLVRRLRPTAHRLTVLDAPAGWGKTSLLAEWCAAGDARVAWVALDTGDNHPVLFWSYVLAALREPLTGIGERALRALPAGGRAIRDAAVPLLVNDLVAQPGPIVLVLDDYHVITDRIVHETVSFLVERVPEHVHVVVATRGNPPLPLGGRAAGADRRRPSVRGSPRSGEAVDRLARRTEPPASRSRRRPRRARRRRRACRGVHRHRPLRPGLLGTEVPRLRRPGIRLRTSILRRLSPESCRPSPSSRRRRPPRPAERAGVFLSEIDPDAGSGTPADR